jgi:hypothetical protein
VVKAEMSPTRRAGVADMNKRTQTAATMAARLRQVALLQRHSASRMRRRCDVSSSIFRRGISVGSSPSATGRTDATLLALPGRERRIRTKIRKMASPLLVLIWLPISGCLHGTLHPAYTWHLVRTGPSILIHFHHVPINIEPPRRHSTLHHPQATDALQPPPATDALQDQYSDRITATTGWRAL